MIDTMKHQIEVGTKFRVHRVGEELIYSGKEYEVVHLKRDCSCKNYGDNTPHLHIMAEPVARDDMSGTKWFNGYDDGLRKIDNPENDYLEVISSSGCQLSMF